MHKTADSSAAYLPSSRTPAIVGLATAVCLAAAECLWSTNAQLASSASFPGVVEGLGPSRLITPSDGGVLSSVLVRDGQPVKKGELLLTFDDGDIRSELLKVKRSIGDDAAIISRASQQDGSPTSKFAGDANGDIPLSISRGKVTSAEASAEESSRKQLNIEVENIHETETALRQEIENVNLALSSAEQDLRASQLLFESGDASASRRNQEARLVADLRVQKIELEARLSSAEAKKDLLQVSYRNDMNAKHERLSMEAMQAEREMLDLQRQERQLYAALARTQVRSPYTGTLNQLTNKRIGDVVAPGAVLGEIVPADDRTIVVAHVTQRFVGSINVGQRVELRPSDFAGEDKSTAVGIIDRIATNLEVERDGSSLYVPVFVSLGRRPGEKVPALTRIGSLLQVIVMQPRSAIFTKIFGPSRSL